MAQTSLLRPEGLVWSPAFTHVVVVPPVRSAGASSCTKTHSRCGRSGVHVHPLCLRSGISFHAAAGGPT
jgi:hypothetical protein